MPKNGQKTSLLDRLARVPGVNIFVSPDEETVLEVKTPAAVNPNAGSTIASQPAVTSPPVSSFVSSLVDSNVDPETRAKIEEIAVRADQVSYKKFVELLAGMRQVFSGDDNAVYKAALAAAKASGYPVAEVLRGVDVILRDLGKFEVDFKSAVPARIAGKLGERQNRVTSMEQNISAQRIKLTELQAEITRVQGNVAKVVQDQQAEKAAMAQDEKTVRDDELRVTTAITAVKSSYLSERQKIEEHGRRL